MKYEETIILLPCHSLEDFPLHHEGDDAQGLLANWSAMWHPALIAATGKLPQWSRVDDPPESLENRLLLAPSVSMHELPTGFAQRAKDEGACFIRKKLDRDEIIGLALAELDGGDKGVDAEFTADMLALGYCFLQVELLTRQMRYASNLDEVYFGNTVVAAAQAAVEGNLETAREKLQACFDVLAEERDHYYPVDAFILDLTLTADTTLGEAFREELSKPTPANVLISGELIAEMAELEPESLAALKEAVAENRAGLIGGEEIEPRLPLLSQEAILGELRSGIAIYEKHVGKRPTVYGRRRYGLTPALPQILTRLGFTGALHATLDDGRFPEGSQIKTRWEGLDGSAIDALARPPRDAAKPETYLGLAMKMGESMDMDHVATLCVAHWPGHASPWYDDLRRVAKHTAALGKFVTIDQFFAETDAPPHNDRFDPDQYRSPYLKQAVIRKHPDPVSTSIRYWKRRAAAEAAQALDTLASLVSGDAAGEHDALLAEIDRAADRAESDDLGARADAAAASAARRFADCLPRQKLDASPGILVANPCSFVRRVGLISDDLDGLPAIERPVYAAGEAHEKTHLVVDVPPMGFAWVEGEFEGDDGKEKKLCEKLDEGGYLLRNEFFEAIISPETGALQSIHEYKLRGNRLSAQLALRIPSERRAGAASYSVMAADEIEIVTNTSCLGEIVARGRLLNKKGERLAGYEITYRLWRGSRVIHFLIDIDAETEPKADPWNAYYGVRFAWAEEAATLHGTVNQTHTVVTQRRFESPHYIEIEEAKTRTTILTGGVPFHRSIGDRMLDVILIPRHERERKFHLGAGIDLKHPMLEAMSLLSPPPVVAMKAAPPSPASSSWLFHIDNRNVVATWWQPLFEEGTAAGYRVRLLETAGRRAKTGVSSFRPATKARELDFQGNPQRDLEVEDGKARIDLSAHGWAEVEVRF